MSAKIIIDSRALKSHLQKLLDSSMKFSERALFIFDHDSKFAIKFTDCENFSCVTCEFHIEANVAGHGQFFLDLRHFLDMFRQAFKKWNNVVIAFQDSDITFHPAFGNVNQQLHMQTKSIDRTMYDLHNINSDIVTLCSIPRKELNRIIDNGIIFLTPCSGICHISTDANQNKMTFAFPNESGGDCSISIHFSDNDPVTHCHKMTDVSISIFLSYFKRIAQMLNCNEKLDTSPQLKLSTHGLQIFEHNAQYSIHAFISNISHIDPTTYL